MLRLDGNVLEELSIADLSACRGSLSHLDLSDNCLSSVEGLKTLVNIQELNLARNKLGRVPDFSQCKKVSIQAWTPSLSLPTLIQVYRVYILTANGTELIRELSGNSITLSSEHTSTQSMAS